MRSLFFSALIPLVLIAAPMQIFAQEQLKPITVDDIWASKKFSARSIQPMVHMNNGETYAYMNDKGIFKTDYLTASKEEVLVDIKELSPTGNSEALVVEEFSFSPDESKLLLTTASEAIYRYSEKSNFYILNLADRKRQALSSGGKQRLAEFSPTSDKVAFVRDNNLFYTNLTSGEEVQVTKDGAFGSIINGSTDWVYEEELDLLKGFFWSPDGSKIAYYKFDESAVKEFTFIEYGELYTTPFSYKYPKAGEANSVVSLWVYDLSTGKSTPMDIGPEKDQYIPRVYWTHNTNQLLVFRMNRLQNKLELLLVDPVTGKNHIAWTETNKCYVDITDNFSLLADDRHFIWLSERDGYNHLWQFELDSESSLLLTPGNFDVMSLKAVDEKKKVLYYTAAETRPENESLFCVGLDGTKKKQLSGSTGVYNAQFTKTYKYYISTWSDANTPPQTSLCNTKGEVLRVIENNKELQDRAAAYKFSPKEFMTIKTSEGIYLNAWMIKPGGFDLTKKYPVLMYVYGGPNSQSVKNSWGRADLIWYQMLAQMGYIIVCVDNRGTGGRGEEFRKCTYKELGKFETIDQIEAAKYLATLPFVDAKRIGIWGWSYGGYVTALCMTKGADVFSAGIAVAPVTNWRNYDNIYTERFMRTPQENPEGYDQNSPTNFASKLKGKLLLVHGGSDDNVHMQNTMEFAAKLVELDKAFEMQIYPNKNHSIYGGKTRVHLYKRMTAFLLQNL